MALHDTTLVVGAQSCSAAASSSGCVHVFSYGSTSWKWNALLTASVSSAGAFFGISVSLHDHLVIGAMHDSSNIEDTGAAYVFTNQHGTWTESAKLTADDATSGAQLGIAVSTFGTCAVIGAPAAQPESSGAVYRYCLSTGTLWPQVCYRPLLIVFDVSTGRQTDS